MSPIHKMTRLVFAKKFFYYTHTHTHTPNLNAKIIVLKRKIYLSTVILQVIIIQYCSCLDRFYLLMTMLLMSNIFVSNTPYDAWISYKPQRNITSSSTWRIRISNDSAVLRKLLCIPCTRTTLNLWIAAKFQSIETNWNTGNPPMRIMRF